jgi:cytochrome P450
MAKFTLGLQSRIIVNTLVGKGYSNKLVEYENEDGKLEQINIATCFKRIIVDSMKKVFHPFNLAFFELIGANIFPVHRRYLRNTDRLKNHLQSLIDDRRKSPTDSSDLLTILINSENYKNDDELMRHDMFVFFLAGMKTIQISTTNMIYYME